MSFFYHVYFLRKLKKSTKNGGQKSRGLKPICQVHYSSLSNKRGHQINMDMGQKLKINKCGQWNKRRQWISSGKSINVDKVEMYLILLFTPQSARLESHSCLLIVFKHF